MSARQAAALLAGAALAIPSPASAADPLLKEKLAPKIQAECRSGTISAASLGKAIYASGVAPLTQEFAWISGGPTAISRAAFAGAAGANETSLRWLRRLAETWTVPGSSADYLPLKEGGIEIRRADGSAASQADAEDALTDMLAGRDSRFEFRCLPAAQPLPQTQDPTPPKPTNPLTIAIAKAPGDLVLPLAKKTFAEVAYQNDRVEKEKSISLYGTVGASFGEFTPVRRNEQDEGLLIRAIPSAFVQLQREGIRDGEEGNKINNLNFGGSLSGFLQPRFERTRTHFYAISARYLTDTEFDSSAWAADVSLTPQIPIRGNIIPYDLIRNRLVLNWLFTGIADYHHVSDPGEKEELADKPEFFRAGFDLRGSLGFLLDSSREHAVLLEGTYQRREALGKSIGDAKRLELGFRIQPSAFYSFGLSFERGRNLDSLEFSKTIKAKLGIRR